MDSYAKAGSIVGEALVGIKVVMAFNGQTEEIQRYSDNLVEAKEGF